MTERKLAAGLFWLLAILLGAGFWVAVIFVAVHFIAKFW